MAIHKNEYELSIWKEELIAEGQKSETKLYIIGTHDMTYPGRATAIKLTKKINGTQTLTFQMPDRFFDNEKGKFVKNEFIDELFAERKIKLLYKGEWYEFFIKKVTENKNYKSFIKTYECTDCFIEELSRNGFGITFDTELYNNVEEIGTFTEEILEDSIWEYHPEHNWGDFTEYLEEKLYKIPIECFGGSISGYKLDFSINNNNNNILTNVYTKETRDAEMGDDLARVNGCFWDQQGNAALKLKKNKVNEIPNDGFVYIPYSCLDFCYTNCDGEPQENTTITIDRAATEVAQNFPNVNSYALAPPSIDPNYIIQFIALPPNEKIEVDEAGLILNKNYTYFITLKEWNRLVKTNYWYMFEDTRFANTSVDSFAAGAVSHTFKYLLQDQNNSIINTAKESLGNKCVYYNGYLAEHNDQEIVKGKKISITDRTELNISDEIDQYVTVYNNKPSEFIGKINFTNEDWDIKTDTNADKYRICSKIDTRQIVPQLSRNLVQNGTTIKSLDGWEVMEYIEDNKVYSSSLDLRYSLKDDSEITSVQEASKTFLYFAPCRKSVGYEWKDPNSNTTYYSNGNIFYTKSNASTDEQITLVEAKNVDQKKLQKVLYNTNETSYLNSQKVLYQYSKNNAIKWKYGSNSVEQVKTTSNNNSFINFGIVGQEKTIEKDKVYCLGFTMAAELNDIQIKIGEGSLISSSTYDLDSSNTIVFSKNNFEGEDQWNWTSDKIKWELLDISNYGLTSEEVGSLKTQFILFKVNKEIKNPYLTLTTNGKVLIQQAYLFEAFTKGRDQFENAKYYKYSGRDLFGSEQPLQSDGAWTQLSIGSCSKPFNEEQIKERIIFEDDVMQGDTYSYQRYFIQRLYLPKGNKSYDTTGVKSFLASKDLVNGKLPLDAAKYSVDDFKIQTSYLDLNTCPYYKGNVQSNECDCNFNNNGGAAVNTCIYQKFGYCPYLFETEKHCRKVRTLDGQKSNRFNLTQELSKVFTCYPVYYINHNENGTIKYLNGKMDKEVFYITEKGNENQLGFRYEKNLSNISRTIASDQIVSKLYVEDVDSELSKTGLCSIKTAEDNPSKDSFIIDFSYYLAKGILNKEEVEKDLYGINKSETSSKMSQGYLKQLGYYNTQYDLLSNKIINLQNASFNELEANLIVNLEGIESAQKQLRKYQQEMDKYKDLVSTDSKDNPTYLNYQTKYAEQLSILKQLIVDTFSTDKQFDSNQELYNSNITNSAAAAPEQFNTSYIVDWSKYIKFDKVREEWVDTHTYDKGILGQYNREYKQLQNWKKEQASYLKEINNLSLKFFQKYEPYLKEGTWSDSNYLTDNAYYFGALEVAAEGAIPKVSYSINVIDLSSLPEYEDYSFEIGDTTYIEDIGMFGINKKTGLPNRLKVLISSITDDLDNPSNNSIEVQNFTTQFEDLFEQVTASIQSLTYNENIYKRSSNFTSLQNIEEDSLQGTLDNNNLILLNTEENNIKLDNQGQSGSDINNHANKYKINGQGIIFSNDGGESWNVGVGPSGINLDYANIGTLDVGKIKITDNNYLYFLWDKNGIVSYRDPANVNTTSTNNNDYSMFNKFGLSIVEQGQIRLRAGYSFNGINGQAISETDPGAQVGFYLFNSDGNTIFSTETSSTLDQDQKAVDTARLSLAGEMFITDDISELSGEIGSYYYNYSVGLTFSQQNAYQFIVTAASEEEETVISINNLEPYNGYIDTDTNTIYKDFYQISTNTNTYYCRAADLALIQVDSVLPSNITLYTREYSAFTFLERLTRVPSATWINSRQGATEQNNCYQQTVANTYTKMPTVYYTGDLSQSYLYWENQEIHNDEPSSGNDISIGLFLNNRISLNPGDYPNNPDYEKRILSVIRKNNQTLENIFTVLRNGSLYIGGNILAQDGQVNSLSQLDGRIKVQNPRIELTANGELRVDFLKFQDLTGRSILDVISNSISNATFNIPAHRHRLNTTYLGNNWLLSQLRLYLAASILMPNTIAGKPIIRDINEENLLLAVQILYYCLNQQLGNNYLLQSPYTNQEESL